MNTLAKSVYDKHTGLNDRTNLEHEKEFGGTSGWENAASPCPSPLDLEGVLQGEPLASGSLKVPAKADAPVHHNLVSEPGIVRSTGSTQSTPANGTYHGPTYVWGPPLIRENDEPTVEEIINPYDYEPRSDYERWNPNI